METMTAAEYLASLAAAPTKAKRSKASPEQDLQNTILAYLALRGIPAWRINSGMVKTAAGGMVRLAPAGFSDIIGIYDGRFLAIEVKTPGNVATVAQEAFLATVRAAGGVAFVAHSVDEVVETLERRTQNVKQEASDANEPR